MIPISSGKYDTTVKHAFICNYVVTGNAEKVCRDMSIPKTTGHEWLKSEWGESLLEQIRTEQCAELDAMHTKIIIDANLQVMDRIENGDYLLDKANELIRKPMDGKSLATVAAITFDKRQISRNMPTSISTSVDNAALTKLQEQFQALSKQSKVIEGEVIED